MELEEMFVPIPFFENFAVSNYGRVIHLKTDIEVHQWHNQVHDKMKVRFRLLGAYVDFFVDDLVAEAFFVDYHPGIEIYHKNGQVSDCTVLNITFDPKYKSEKKSNLWIDPKGRIRYRS